MQGSALRISSEASVLPPGISAVPHQLTVAEHRLEVFCRDVACRACVQAPAGGQICSPPAQPPQAVHSAAHVADHPSVGRQQVLLA